MRCRNCKAFREDMKMMTISKTSVKTALPFVGVFALGLLVGLAIPTSSNSISADFANAPLTSESQPTQRKRRIVRVVEKPANAPVICDASTPSQEPVWDESEEKFVYKGGKKVITKTCQPPEEKSAKMPNLFKE